MLSQSEVATFQTKHNRIISSRNRYLRFMNCSRLGTFPIIYINVKMSQVRSARNLRDGFLVLARPFQEQDLHVPRDSYDRLDNPIRKHTPTFPRLYRSECDGRISLIDKPGLIPETALDNFGGILSKSVYVKIVQIQRNLGLF